MVTSHDDCIMLYHMDVSVNGGTPKSSILIGFSIINHPFWGTPIFGNTHIPLIFRDLHLAPSPPAFLMPFKVTRTDHGGNRQCHPAGGAAMF